MGVLFTPLGVVRVIGLVSRLTIKRERTTRLSELELNESKGRYLNSMPTLALKLALAFALLVQAWVGVRAAMRPCQGGHEHVHAGVTHSHCDHAHQKPLHDARTVEAAAPGGLHQGHHCACCCGSLPLPDRGRTIPDVTRPATPDRSATAVCVMVFGAENANASARAGLWWDPPPTNVLRAIRSTRLTV